MTKRKLFACIILGVLLGSSNAHAGGKGVLVTLADNLNIPANSGVDLDPVNVNLYRKVSFLAFCLMSDGDTFLNASIAFATESGKYSDPIPKLQTASCIFLPGWGAQCRPFNGPVGGDGVFTVAGPFLTVHLSNNASGPCTLTLKAYLTK